MATDGLLAVFFFVVGLELKRELVVGELSSARRALLPVAAVLLASAVAALIAAAMLVRRRRVHSGSRTTPVSRPDDGCA